MKRLGWLFWLCSFLGVAEVGYAQKPKELPQSLPAIVKPDPEAAKLHFQKAKLLYEIGKFEEAIAEYQQAYLFDQKSEFLYNLAQTYRRQGEITGQVEPLRLAKFHFETFLKKDPKTPYRRDVEGLIRDIERDIKRAEEKLEEAAKEKKRFQPREEKAPTTPDPATSSKATDDTLRMILGKDFSPFVESGLTLDGYLETKRGKRNAVMGVGLLTGGLLAGVGSAILSFGARFQDSNLAQTLGAGGFALSSVAVGSGAFLLPYGLFQRASGKKDKRVPLLPMLQPSTTPTQETQP